MTKTEATDFVHSVLLEHFANRISGNTLAPQTHLKRDLGFDSMDSLALIAALENELDEPLAIEGELSTINHIVSLLANIK